MSYETVAEDYNMTDSQSAKYIDGIFKGEALRYFYRAEKHQSTSYREIKSLMLHHFNSSDVQNRIKNELMTLCFSAFVEKDGTKTKAFSAISVLI